MIDELTKLFEQDLDRLKEEIEAFRQDRNLWKTTGNISNSAGNLCLHLVGNLNTFIGNNIGKFPYTRDREAEFSLKDVPKQKLIAQVEEVKEIVKRSLGKIDDATIEDVYIAHRLGNEMSNSFLLMHLAAHLSYHLGQINYLRRMLEP
jgi:uncharacterized damage-inducible protein DinB